MALPVAMTTSFAHAAALSPTAIVDVLGRADVAGVVLDAELDPARFELLSNELSGSNASVRVLALESPCPSGRESGAQLCASDREEARVALQAAEATVRRASTLGAAFVVVRLGQLREVDREWTLARQRFLRGELDAASTRKLVAARDGAAERGMDVARRGIERLARTAEAAGVRLLVRNPKRFVELPSPRELDFLLADVAGAPVAPLLDTANAHLPSEMGVWPFELTVAAFGPRSPLLYLADACGPVGGLEPGRGIVDFAFVERLPRGAEIVFNAWSGLTPAEAEQGARAVAQLSLRRSG